MSAARSEALSQADGSGSTGTTADIAADGDQAETRKRQADQLLDDVEKPEMGANAFLKYAGSLDKLETNTPTKSKQNSSVWHNIKRLPRGDRDKYGKKTHVCTALTEDGSVCCTLLRLTKVKEVAGQEGIATNWQTGFANNHLRLCHQATSSAGKASAKRKEIDQESKECKMFAQGMNQAVSGKQGGLGRYTLTHEERALTSQARWYIYSRMHISKREFEGEEFREMLKEQAGGRGVHLTTYQLKEWVRAEFRIFLSFLRYMMAIKMEEAQGNPFSQALHDGGTLSNHTKFQACGLQFIAERGDENLVVCIGLVKSAHNTDVDVAHLFKEVCKERTGFEFSELCMAVVSDRAAKGVSHHLNMEEEVCEMHDTDKIGQSATGALTRSRNRIVVNPFPEGVALLKAARAMATHFSYSNRLDELHACVVKDNQGNSISQPQIRFAIDLNGTRIAAQHGLLYSALRLNRSVKVYVAQSSPSWALSDTQWQSLSELESVLDITKTMSTLSQSEAIFLGAYGPVLKAMTLARLRGEEMSVVNLASVNGAQTIPTRKQVAEVELSETGRTALNRARLEAERRWCGNLSDVVANDSTPNRCPPHPFKACVDPPAPLSMAHSGPPAPPSSVSHHHQAINPHIGLRGSVSQSYSICVH